MKNRAPGRAARVSLPRGDGLRPKIELIAGRAPSIVAATVCAVGLYAGPSWPNNGLVAIGNGATQLGMAGAGTAMAQDAAATLRNPAAGAWLGDSMTADLGIAVPNGGFTAGPVGPGSTIGLLDLSPESSTSVKGYFPIPSFARNWRLDDRQAWGIGVTASGLKSLSSGNTATLARGIPVYEARCDGTFGGGAPLSATTDLAGLCGRNNTSLGVNLAQVFLSAHWAYRVRDDLSLGVAPVFLFQRLSVHGLGAYAAFSNRPDRTTDTGGSYAYGGGARLGLLWEVAPGIGLGLAYQSRVYTTAFTKYQGAIIGGSFDGAPVYDLGLQIHLAPEHRLLLDAEYIGYGDIKPIANRVDPQRFTDQCFVPRLLARSLPNPPALDACLGGPSGPGFGWKSIPVYKIGYQFQRGRLSLRAGYSYGENPVQSDQILSAVTAPAITKQHATIGVSWALTPRLSFGWALIDAIENRISVPNLLSNATLRLQGSQLVQVNVDPDPRDQIIKVHLNVWQSQFGLTWTLE